MRTTLQKRTDSEKGHNVVELNDVCRGRRTLLTVPQVSQHGQMRKQAIILEDVSDAALFDRDANTGAGVGQHGAVELNEPLVRRQQPGDEIDERGLAAAGAAK